MGLDSDQRHEEGGPRLAKAGEKEKEERKREVEGCPCSPVVKISPSSAGCAGLIPGQGTKSPHASWPKNQI